MKRSLQDRCQIGMEYKNIAAGDKKNSGGAMNKV